MCARVVTISSAITVSVIYPLRKPSPILPIIMKGVDSDIVYSVLKSLQEKGFIDSISAIRKVTYYKKRGVTLEDFKEIVNL